MWSWIWIWTWLSSLHVIRSAWSLTCFNFNQKYMHYCVMYVILRLKGTFFSWLERHNCPPIVCEEMYIYRFILYQKRFYPRIIFYEVCCEHIWDWKLTFPKENAFKNAYIFFREPLFRLYFARNTLPFLFLLYIVTLIPFYTKYTPRKNQNSKGINVTMDNKDKEGSVCGAKWSGNSGSFYFYFFY